MADPDVMAFEEHTGGVKTALLILGLIVAVFLYPWIRVLLRRERHEQG